MPRHLDDNTSLVDFDAVQGATLTGGGSIVIAGSGSSGTGTTTSAGAASSPGSTGSSQTAQGQTSP